MMRKVKMIEKQFLDMESTVQKILKGEEIDYGCGSDNNPNVNANDDQQPKRKCYHRHTLSRIQELEAFFKECPHPDDKQKEELSRQLGMDVLQIKFWFQNKHTQMKAEHDRQENSRLRIENEKLRAENMRHTEVLKNVYSAACDISTSIDMSLDERHLRMQNARLRDEIEYIAAMAAKYVGNPLPFTDSATNSSSSAPPPSLAAP